MVSYHNTVTRGGGISYFCCSPGLVQYGLQNHIIGLRQKGNSMKTLYSPRGMNPVVIAASFHAWKTVHLSCNVLPSPQISTVQYVLWHDLSKLFLSQMFLPLHEEILLKAFTSTLKSVFFFLPEDFANFL